MSIPAAGGPQQRAGDYLYSDGRALKLQEGAWGLLRVLEGPTDDSLAALPGHDPPVDPPPPICPPTAPRRAYAVTAVELALPMLGAEPGRAFVEASHLDAVLSGARTPTPLVLRAAVGDCIEVTLDNQLPSGAPPVSLHADGLAYDPADSGGVEAGNNPPQTVPVGSTRTYTFFAHPEYGTGAAMLRDGGDLAHSGSRGLYGAIAIAPEGSSFDDAASWSTVVRTPNDEAWRDVVLFMHDDGRRDRNAPHAVHVRGQGRSRFELRPRRNRARHRRLRRRPAAPTRAGSVERAGANVLARGSSLARRASDGRQHPRQLDRDRRPRGDHRRARRRRRRRVPPCPAGTNSATTASPTAKPG